MRYHEFKVVNEGFWDSLLSLTRRDSAPQAAEKTWMTNFAQRVKTALDTAIKSGTVDTSNTTKLNPSNPKPTSGSAYSISDFIYLLLEKEYRNVYASLNKQSKPLYINAINKVQDEYLTDKGKQSLFNFAGVFSSIVKTSTPDPVAPAPATLPKITSMAPFPAGKQTVRARVGNKVEKFRYVPGSKQWLDKNNHVISDAESIDALNKIAKSQTIPPTP
jgi:hypothetical protein